MSKNIHTASKAREFDRKAIDETGIPSLVLMEHAAIGCADFLQKAFPEESEFLIFCGPGNNGADGLAIARLLKNRGQNAACLLDENGPLSPDEKIQLNAAKNLGIEIHPYGQVSSLLAGSRQQGNPAVLVDALFGSGLSRPITEGSAFDGLIAQINEADLPVVSIDIPSGLDGNTGHAQAAVRADITLALDCLKTGHILDQGPACSGKLEVVDITIPESFHAEDPEQIIRIDEDLAASLLPSRSPLGYKGKFGKVLMCGGSMAMQGAIAMASEACFHAGCGTLTLFTPKPAARVLASKMDLAMILEAPHINGYFAKEAAGRLDLLVQNYSLLGAGNGIGRGEGAQAVTASVLASDKPLVLDADGLSCAALQPESLNRKAPLILTPHVGEFSRLSGKTMAEIESDPLGAMDQFMKEHPGVILVLKSDVTFVTDGHRKFALVHPNSALSKGGSGDVLCGLITGLFAQGMKPLDAAVLGVWIHSAAAALAEDPFTFTPLQLIENLPPVFRKLMDLKKAA